MKWFSLLVIALCGLRAAGAADYATAYADSVKSGKPLLVICGASWCPHCQALHRSVLPIVEQAGGFRGIAVAEIDTDNEPGLAKTFMSGTMIPQMTLLPAGAGVQKQKPLRLIMPGDDYHQVLDFLSPFSKSLSP